MFLEGVSGPVRSQLKLALPSGFCIWCLSDDSCDISWLFLKFTWGGEGRAEQGMVTAGIVVVAGRPGVPSWSRHFLSV